jgi:hypothetical protein
MKRLILFMLLSSLGFTADAISAETKASTQALSAAASDEPTEYWQVARPEQVCAISDVYEIQATGGRPPFVGVANLVRVSIGGRDVWRAMHYILDPVDMAKKADGRIFFDVVDADAKTLDIISSTHRFGQRVTAFEFSSAVVTKLASDTQPEEKLTLNDLRPIPEGPGNLIFVQSVPWRVGLALRASQVDRWRGTGQERLRDVRIKVLGQETLKIDGRDTPVFSVETRAEDGSFKVESLVTVKRPHREVRVAYYPTASSPPTISIVRNLTSAANCPT